MRILNLVCLTAVLVTTLSTGTALHADESIPPSAPAKIELPPVG